jgi:hypothetical protein
VWWDRRGQTRPARIGFGCTITVLHGTIPSEYARLAAVSRTQVQRIPCSRPRSARPTVETASKRACEHDAGRRDEHQADWKHWMHL